MKKIFWFATGIAAGLAMAKRIAEDPKAQALVDDAVKRARDFGSAVSEGFKERETELAAPKKIVRKPAAKKPTTKTAAAKKPAARKPAAKKPAAK